MKENMMKNFFSTARITGLFYLGLAVTGMFSFLFVRTKLYVAADPIATTTNFITQESLARSGVAAELALVFFQALAALWFFKLFRKTNLFAAVALCAFGTVNAVAILISNAFWLSAVAQASGSVLPPTADQARSMMQLFQMHESILTVSQLFFGLWLLPMGYLAYAARMPRLLSWVLVGGGVGYVVSAFLNILGPTQFAPIIEAVTLPASIGEFWMIGYLLIKPVPEVENVPSRNKS